MVAHQGVRFCISTQRDFRFNRTSSQIASRGFERSPQGCGLGAWRRGPRRCRRFSNRILHALPPCFTKVVCFAGKGIVPPSAYGFEPVLFTGLGTSGARTENVSHLLPKAWRRAFRSSIPRMERQCPWDEIWHIGPRDDGEFLKLACQWPQIRRGISPPGGFPGLWSGMPFGNRTGLGGG